MSSSHGLTFSAEICELIETLPVEQRQQVSRSFELLSCDPVDHLIIHVARRNMLENRYAAYLSPGFDLEVEYIVNDDTIHVVKWTTRYPLIVFDADHRVIVPPVVAYEVAAVVSEGSPKGSQIQREWRVRARTRILDFRDLPDLERATALYTLGHSLSSRVKQAIGKPELFETASHEQMAQATYSLPDYLDKASRLAGQQAEGAYRTLHARLGTMPWEEPEYIERMRERYS